MSSATSDAQTVTSLAAAIGAPEALVAKARANITSGAAAFLVVSGWMGSGKDTIAPETLAKLGYTDSEHLYYALPLKAELDAIIADIRSWFFTGGFPSMTHRRREELAALLAQTHRMPVEHAMFFVGRLLDQVRMNRLVHARTRTPVIREALQKLGTDVRRAQDADYWVKQALIPAVEALAAGRSVYFTDARFPNEVANAAALGAFSVRLDISREVQLARLMARDHIAAPSPEQLFHDSETSLDAYPDFDVRVDNTGTLAECLAAVEAAWSQRAPVPLTA